MISARKPGQARSNNRARQDRDCECPKADRLLGRLPVWLLADCAVDRLPEEVGVAGVASRLLDQVQKNPAE